MRICNLLKNVYKEDKTDNKVRLSLQKVKLSNILWTRSNLRIYDRLKNVYEEDRKDRKVKLSSNPGSICGEVCCQVKALFNEL